MTPYEAHTIANNAFDAAGVKRVRSQMLYNYTSGKLNKGEKPLIRFTREAGVDADDLQRWIKSYIAKKIATNDKIVDIAKARKWVRENATSDVELDESVVSTDDGYALN
jgi:hypothetical protein